MAYEVVREVTQPVHGADGSVTHRPGDRLRLDEPVPEGVPYRMVITEVPGPETVPGAGPVQASAPKRGAARRAAPAGDD